MDVEYVDLRSSANLLAAVRREASKGRALFFNGSYDAAS